MADDKVRELARKIWTHEFNGDTTAQLEELLRAELKPLLDAAEEAEKYMPAFGKSLDAKERLAAELKGWTK